jgi:hypothetical protein
MRGDAPPRGIRRVFRLAPWRRTSIERELEEELRLHVDERAAQYRATGYSAADAMHEAVGRFGSIALPEQRLKRTARRREPRCGLSI